MLLKNRTARSLLLSPIAPVLLPAALLTAGIVPAAMAQSGAATPAQQAQSIPVAPAPDWAIVSDDMPVPDDAQGSFFFRRQDSIVRLTAAGTQSFQSQRLRILNPQGLQAGNIAIAWNPAAGAAQVHAVRIHRGSRVIDVLEETQFEILRREDQLEQAMLDGNLTASLRVPDLRVGDDLELAYTVPLHDPTMQDNSHGLLFMADSPPSGRYRIELSWEEGQEPRLKLTGDLESIAERSENAITLRFDNPEPFTIPRYAPPRFQWSRTLQFSDFRGWNEVSSRFHALFDNASALAPDSPLIEEAALIAADNPGKLAQAQAALKLVQQQVRYIYVGLNGGNFTPASADLTWERRYGDCKGKTVMLLAILRELGIEAEAVLVANSIPTDGHPDRLANPGLFDHVLVRARIEGKQYWMDGTLPAVIEAREQPFLRYRSVLPLSAKGEKLEQLPESPIELPEEMGIIDIDASAGFDAPAKKTEIILKRGPSALQAYYSFSSVSASQLEAALRSQLVGNRQWDSVDSIKFRFDTDTQASILTIIGSGPVDWESDDDGSYLLRLPGGGFRPPNRRQRSDGEAEDMPYWQSAQYTCYATTVRLPKETDLAKWWWNSTFDTMLYGRAYYRAMEKRDDHSIRMVRGSRTDRTEITPDRAKRDNGRLSDFDNSMATISYYPESDAADFEQPHNVPATDEIDWTGRDIPCLPADMLED